MTELKDTCKNCQKHCCTHPCLTLPEYIKFLLAVGDERVQAARPEPYNGCWIFRGTPCPASTPTGCMIEYNDRPQCCRIYPFVKIPIITKDLNVEYKLFLDVDRCPHWDVFGRGYEDVKKEIANAKT